MKIVIFTHPSFHGSESMPRFAKMLGEGMRLRGHQVEFWSAGNFFYRISSSYLIKKWLGYIDQYVIFPLQVKVRLRNYSPQTLFVFADQALGMWFPLVANRHHVIHCHDFLAQKSALGKISENPTSWTGIKYQDFIRNGFRQGRNFISVSRNTRTDLHKFLCHQPSSSTVVYNGLNTLYVPSDPIKARAELCAKTGLNLFNGYLLHVGGNQWYKNREGVLEIYNAWRTMGRQLPLLMIGAKPNSKLEESFRLSPFKKNIHFLTNVDDKDLHLAYAGASVFVFPSLAEGFGWPIAEAMASGCPVITTNEAPMTEVADKAGFYIPSMPLGKKGIENWAKEAAKKINEILAFSPEQREKVLAMGLVNTERFDLKTALDKIETVYREILEGKKVKYKWKYYV